MPKPCTTCKRKVKEDDGNFDEDDGNAFYCDSCWDKKRMAAAE